MQNYIGNVLFVITLRKVSFLCTDSWSNKVAVDIVQLLGLRRTHWWGHGDVIVSKIAFHVDHPGSRPGGLPELGTVWIYQRRTNYSRSNGSRVIKDFLKRPEFDRLFSVPIGFVSINIDSCDCKGGGQKWPISEVLGAESSQVLAGRCCVTLPFRVSKAKFPLLPSEQSYLRKGAYRNCPQ